MTVKNNNTRRKYDNSMPVTDEGWWESVLAEERMHASSRIPQPVLKSKTMPQEKIEPVQVIEPDRVTHQHV